jgi:hypothetical protein
MASGVPIVNHQAKIERRQSGVEEGAAAPQVTYRDINVVDHAMSTTQSGLIPG